MARNKNILTSAAWSLLAHLFGRGSFVLASIILARNLDTRQYAEYSYFQITVSMLAAYAAMGMGVTASKFFAENSHVTEEEGSPLGSLWLLSIFMGAVSAIAAICVPSSWLSGKLDVPQWQLALGIFSISVGVVPAGAILGLERYAEATYTAVVSGAVLILGSFYAAQTKSSTVAMEAFIFASLVSAIGNSLVVLRDVGLKRILSSARFGRLEALKIFGVAAPMIGVTMLAASGSWAVGRIILNGSSGERGFALYAIGIQWFSLALLLPGMVSRVVLPRLVRARLKADSAASPDVGKRLVQQSTLLTLASAITVCFAGILLSPALLKLYGSDYQINKWMIAAFMLAAIPSAPANTLGNAIVASDGQVMWLRMTFFWFICLIVTALLVVKSGPFAGAIAQAVAALGLTAMAYVFSKRKGLI